LWLPGLSLCRLRHRWWASRLRKREWMTSTHLVKSYCISTMRAPSATRWKVYRPAHQKPCLSLFRVRVWVIPQVLDISGDSNNSCLFVGFSTFQYLVMMGWWWMAAFLD
jgi:hypothetical protein